MSGDESTSIARQAHRVRGGLMPLDPTALLGTWTLEWAVVVDGDTVIDPEPFGPAPVGVIHYLADGRMAAMIARRARPPLAGGRLHASEEDRLRAASGFVAFAGRYDIEADRVIHHVEMNAYPNDVGTDYVRYATLDGDTLDLATPADVGDGQRPMRLRWRRYRP